MTSMEEGEEGVVCRLGLPQYKGFVFKVDLEGNILRGPLGVHSDQYDAECEIFMPQAFPVETGYNYSVDSEGDVVRVRNHDYYGPVSRMEQEEYEVTDELLSAINEHFNQEYQDKYGDFEDDVNKVLSEKYDSYPTHGKEKKLFDAEVEELFARFRREKEEKEKE